LQKKRPSNGPEPGFDDAHLPSRVAALAPPIAQGAQFPLPLEATVMNTSDVRTNIEGSELSSLVTRIADLKEAPVLTLVETVEPSDEVCSTMPDPLIQALVGKLPKPNSIWSLEDRAKWLRAAAIIFNLVYKPGAGDEPALKTEEKPSGLKSAG